MNSEYITILVYQTHKERDKAFQKMVKLMSGLPHTIINKTEYCIKMPTGTVYYKIDDLSLNLAAYDNPTVFYK